MQNNLFKYLTCFISGFVLGFVIYYMFSSKVNYLQSKTIEHKDTIFEIKQCEPIIISKFKTNTVYKSDTLIESKPFTAFIDTVIIRDTIRASFDFPDKHI